MHVLSSEIDAINPTSLHYKYHIYLTNTFMGRQKQALKYLLHSMWRTVTRQQIKIAKSHYYVHSGLSYGYKECFSELILYDSHRPYIVFNEP